MTAAAFGGGFMLFGRIVLAAVAAAALSSVAASGQAQSGPTQAKKWSANVQMGASGRYRMGRPDAPAQLVAFATFGCAKCQDFMANMPALRALADLGIVNFEFHNGVNAPFDAAASLIAQCAPPSRYYDVTQGLYDARMNLVAAQFLLSMEFESDTKKGRSPKEADVLDSAASHADMYAIAERLGIPRNDARKCVRDEKALAVLRNHHKVMFERGAKSLPAFFVNGSLASPGGWDELWPHLVKSVPKKSPVGGWQFHKSKEGNCGINGDFGTSGILLRAFDNGLLVLAVDESWKLQKGGKTPVVFAVENQFVSRPIDWVVEDAQVAGIKFTDGDKLLPKFSRSDTFSVLKLGESPTLTRFAMGKDFQSAYAQFTECEAARRKAG